MDFTIWDTLSAIPTPSPPKAVTKPRKFSDLRGFFFFRRTTRKTFDGFHRISFADGLGRGSESGNECST